MRASTTFPTGVSTMGSSIAMATDFLRRAAVRATWAQSISNTQPWRLRLDADGLHLYADRTRQLNVVDPTGRLLLMSIGCALLNARVSLAADGVGVRIARFPSGAEPDRIATLVASDANADPTTASGPAGPDASLGALAALLDNRCTDDRLFYSDAVPDDLVSRLGAAAQDEGASLVAVAPGDDRRSVHALSVHADAIENLNPAYRAEVRAWTPAGHRVPTGALADLADESQASSYVALLCTDGDAPENWLDAGAALQRMLLVTADAGFAARAHTQVTEVRSVRSQLRRDLGLSAYPHVLVRLGRAPSAPMPARRRLVDVLTEVQ